MQKKGYRIILIFFWLNSPLIAIERIKYRVKKGGHHVPDNVVKRRYVRGLENLFRLYIPVVDHFFIINNLQKIPSFVAEGQKSDVITYDKKVWSKLKSGYDKEK